MSQEEKKKDNQEEKPVVKSKLGKEAKIGVSVILVLLVVLGIVVVVKMTGPSEDEQVALGSDRDLGKGKPGGLGLNDPKAKDAKPKFPPADKQTTYLSPKKDDSKRMSSNYGATPGSKSPFSSEPSKPFPDDRSGTYGSERPKGNAFVDEKPLNKGSSAFGIEVSDEKPKQHKKPDDKGFAKKGASKPGDLPPFQDEPSRPFPEDRGNAYGDAKPRENAASELGIVVSDEKPLRGKHREEYGRAADDRDGSGGLGRNDDLPPPLPPHRENDQYGDQYGDSKPLPPVTPSWEETSSKRASRNLPPPPTTPVSRSNGGDRRHKSDEPLHGGNELPNDFDRPSYGSTPPRLNDGKYEVQPNDSYWKISQKFYGTDGYFKALVEVNRGAGIDENNLKPGQIVSVPPVAQLEKSYPELCPKASRREQPSYQTSTVSTRNQFCGGRTYTVAEGDTLFNIARYELGKASRWAEIYDLNRDVLGNDFNYLKPGTRLTLPDGEKADVLTRQPREDYRR